MATNKAKNLGNLLLQAKKGASGSGDTDGSQGSRDNSVRSEAKRNAKADGNDSASPDDFWGQFEKEGAEATDRLNVEIKRSLHERFKRRCSELGVTKREAVEALIEWCLTDK